MIEVCYIYIYEESIMKSTEHCLKGWKEKEGELKHNGGGELVQGTLYTHIYGNITLKSPHIIN
jgi:hypothetical protein